MFFQDFSTFPNPRFPVKIFPEANPLMNKDQLKSIKIHGPFL